MKYLAIALWAGMFGAACAMAVASSASFSISRVSRAEGLTGIVESWDGTRLVVRADPANQSVRLLPSQKVTVTGH